MYYINSDAKNDFRAIEILTLNKGNVLLLFSWDIKSCSLQLALLSWVPQRRACHWDWICHCLMSSRGSFWLLMVRLRFKRLIILYSVFSLSSCSTSSLSFFHGPINLSQGYISNWLQTICSRLCDEHRCQNLLIIYRHCRPPGRWRWRLFQLIRALWDTWRDAKG